MNTQSAVLLPREAPVSKRRAPPVAPDIKERSKRSLAYWVSLARQRFNHPLFMPTISFDLVGMTAGKAFLRERHVQLNAVLLTENLESFEKDTIPHELAHLIVFHLLGYSGGHGQQWKDTMCRMGLVPARTQDYDVTNSRTTQPVNGYVCGCGNHPVSLKSHKKLLRGATATCKRCRQRVRWAGAVLPATRQVPSTRLVPPTYQGGPAPTPPRPTGRQPSEAMLRFATALALKHRIDVPVVVKVDFEACRAFLDKWSKAPVMPAVIPAPVPVYRAVVAPTAEAPPTERQLAYAKSIAGRKKLTIPADVLKSKQKLSQWIDRHS